jgi:hypothetical protein
MFFETRSRFLGIPYILLVFVGEDQGIVFVEERGSLLASAIPCAVHSSLTLERKDGKRTAPKQNQQTVRPGDKPVNGGSRLAAAEVGQQTAGDMVSR